ncbi:hypothetical protein ACUXCC_002316 [Cytobacillus horneckiae]|uniref:Uncharacterized protein n=1 Tax=Cytobacillus horneckiae TaxID=549687 RepID=A0A2N0ZD53_9BACI|nr:hypothetical protein [Cytobacillus horneckiae]MBN6887292.1 hypothetical protein [Cytobacillus horneckiae]MCM3178115.1 hypothetical protein [Cytobacillus horneckiae]MEC1157146.1 hypothetical protein [Cytobacillus horneckiae]PKG27424.1 hypothetical protein CWS20_18715 [Cytobacillus horneckiae]
MKIKITVGVLAIVLIGGLIFYFTTFFVYQQSEKFFGFPIPKNAELVSEKGLINIYDWSRASEENGIPFDYELVIKAKGWKFVDREGASTYYEKEGYRIDLISTTDHLEIRVLESKN